MNNHLSWLELSPQIPAPPSLLQETPLAVHCPVSTATTCSPGWVPSGPMVSGLAWLAPAATHKKVNEKVGKIPWMGKEILVLQFGKTKKGAFIHGTLLSVPYPSHLVKGTRRQQWHFLVAKVLIKNECIAKRLLFILKTISPTLFDKCCSLNRTHFIPFNLISYIINIWHLKPPTIRMKSSHNLWNHHNLYFPTIRIKSSHN